MRIAIDAHTFSPDEMTGGDVYVHNLVREFAALDQEDAFVVLLNAFSKATLECARRSLANVVSPNFTYVPSRLPSRLPERVFNAWYYGVTVPRALRRHEIEVFFGTNYYAVTKGAVRKVVKIHDVGPLVHPEFTHPKMFKSFQRDMLRVTAAADAVITDTEQTKQDIVATLAVPPEKVVPIYEAPETCYYPSDRDEACALLEEQYRIEHPFFLFVGTVQPRKNVANLIRAFERLKQKMSVAHELIVVGKVGWGHEEAIALWEESAVRRSIRFLHYVPKAHLPAFYTGAEALVWPSFYEGIGLPLLEAMACGTPVITSDRGSMKETVGNAGLLADPDDPGDIAERMWDVVAGRTLRNSLRRRGLHRAAEFAWRKTAAQTLAVLRGEGVPE